MYCSQQENSSFKTRNPAKSAGFPKKEEKMNMPLAQVNILNLKT
jgi:hypothetical protein